MKSPTIHFRQIFMVPIAVAFMSGILLFGFFELDQQILLISAILILACFAFLSTKQLKWSHRGPVLLTAFIILGALHCSYGTSFKKNKLLPFDIVNQDQVYNVEVTGTSHSKKYINLEGILTNLQVDNLKDPISLSQPSVLIKLKRNNLNSQWRAGSSISISTRLIELSRDGGDSFNTYLYSRGYQYLCYVNSQNITSAAHPTFYKWKWIRYELRNSALMAIDRHITNEKSAAILKALLLGYKQDLSQSSRISFANSGTMHILAVSGLHVGIVAYLLYIVGGIIFRWSGRYSLLRASFVILGLVFFAEISGGAPPVWRATIMTIVYLLGRVFSYESHPLNLLAICGMTLSLIDPLVIYNLSFQLSFIAVSGIILIYPILKRIYHPQNWLSQYLTGIIYMGIAAQIALTPLSLYYFNQVSMASPISSIIAIPSAFVIIVGGTGLLALGWLDTFMTDWIVNIIEFAINIFSETAEWISVNGIGLIEYIYLSNIEVILLFAFIVLLIRSYYTASIPSLKLAICVLATQGFLHSLYQIDHAKHISVLYQEDSKAISEIYIGQTAYIAPLGNMAIDHQSLKKRKKHHITSVIQLESIDINAIIQNKS